MNLDQLLEKQKEAIRSYLKLVQEVRDDLWLVPMAPGKWSPAELTAHVTTAFHLGLNELNGKGGMKIVVSPWKGFILKYTVMQAILKKGVFPRRAPAPRETRPVNITGTKDELSADLLNISEELASLVIKKVMNREKITINHAYFGKMKLRDAIKLNTRHTLHHARQLEKFIRSSG